MPNQAFLSGRADRMNPAAVPTLPDLSAELMKMAEELRTKLRTIRNTLGGEPPNELSAAPRPAGGLIGGLEEAAVTLRSALTVAGDLEAMLRPSDVGAGHYEARQQA